jgi:hypothetical protein
MANYEFLIKRLYDLIKGSEKYKIDLSLKDKKSLINDFNSQRTKYYINHINSTIEKLKDISSNSIDKKDYELIQKLATDDKAILKKNVESLILRLKDESDSKEIYNKVNANFPNEIKSEMNADINEINKCMSAECYRSAIILCGRILETSLHRLYYETTQNDILEKNPGIGLGTLIAKLKEKNVSLDPALTQQIHLINQVRIFSVHKKQETFNPSKAQAQAIVLYTFDVVEKLFKR